MSALPQSPERDVRICSVAIMPMRAESRHGPTPSTTAVVAP